jgi:predicted DNA-binding WGR domain protein
MKLYQKSRTGKTKFLDIHTDGSKLVTEWGTLGGKIQKTIKVCKPMNEGKANEKTAAEQAKAEMESKITLKKKEGYSEDVPTGKTVISKIDLDDIPSEFCPVKPISECPASILESTSTIAQRKHNGHCVFLVKGSRKEKVYSRRMEDLTETCSGLPFIKEQLAFINAGDFILTEIVFHHTKLDREIPRFVAQVIRNEDPDEASKRYTELSKEGTFSCKPFDILFFKNQFVGDKKYTDRWSILKSMKLNGVVDFLQWFGPTSSMVEAARKAGWEGFVLRHPEKSQISYSMDGKAHRQGSYKFKFTQTGDFVVDEALKGKSGKHSTFFSKFHIIEYGPNTPGLPTGPHVIDRGYVGPGTLDHDQLKQLTKEITTQKRKIPFVVEVEYQSVHDDTGKLEFGIIQRIREDKKPEECVAEE